MNEAEREVVALEGEAALKGAMISTIGAARQSLLILSQRLDPRLYRDLKVIEALRHQAVTERRLSIRILVSEPKAALRDAEALIGLARRLDSKFTLHEPASGEHVFEEDLLLADSRAYVQRSHPENLIAKYAQDDPRGGHALEQHFENHWRNSRPSVEFRQLI